MRKKRGIYEFLGVSGVLNTMMANRPPGRPAIAYYQVPGIIFYMT